MRKSSRRAKKQRFSSTVDENPRRPSDPARPDAARLALGDLHPKRNGHSYSDDQRHCETRKERYRSAPRLHPHHGAGRPCAGVCEQKATAILTAEDRRGTYLDIT